MKQSLDRAKPITVCLVHDWLVAMRGGEKVLDALCEIFPHAPIYTLFVNKKNLSQTLKERMIYPSFLQYFPGIFKCYRWLLPLFPIAIRSLNLSQYDVIISVSHCVAKSVRVPENSIHICYCNSPMRYVWEFTADYFGHWHPFVRWLIGHYFKWLKGWDQKTAQEVTYFIGNSVNIANKINKYYGRDAVAIHPAVDLDGHDCVNRGEYFLSVGALVPYKRVELAIEACNQLRRPLRIIGDGPSRRRLEKLVTYSGIIFEGWVDEQTLMDRYENARALLFPGDEDFGVVPLEAGVFGKPVIAFGKGGVLETVIPHINDGTRNARNCTGVFFEEQTVAALVEAIMRLELLEFDARFIRNHAQKFNRNRLIRELTDYFRSLGITADSSDHLCLPIPK